MLIVAVPLLGQLNVIGLSAAPAAMFLTVLAFPTPLAVRVFD